MRILPCYARRDKRANSIPVYSQRVLVIHWAALPTFKNQGFAVQSFKQNLFMPRRWLCSSVYGLHLTMDSGEETKETDFRKTGAAYALDRAGYKASARQVHLCPLPLYTPLPSSNWLCNPRTWKPTSHFPNASASPEPPHPIRDNGAGLINEETDWYSSTTCGKMPLAA